MKKSNQTFTFWLDNLWLISGSSLDCRGFLLISKTCNFQTNNGEVINCLWFLLSIQALLIIYYNIGGWQFPRLGYLLIAQQQMAMDQWLRTPRGARGERQELNLGCFGARDVLEK